MQNRFFKTTLVLSFLTLCLLDNLSSYAENTVSGSSSGAKPSARDLSAADGVILLEKILEKMHALPQVAFNNVRQELNVDKNKDVAQARNACPVVASGKDEQFDWKQSMRASAKLSPLHHSPSLSWSPSVSQQGSSAQSCKVAQAPATPVMDASASFSNSCSNKPSAINTEEAKLDSDPLSRSKQKGTLSKTFPESYNARARTLNLKKAQGGASTQYVAILPPTVIKGIPLVTLGNSDKVVLKQISKNKQLTIKRESVHDWSVWSVYSAKSNKCSAQIFLRKQIVEAIRIFDQSFIQPGIGAGIGNDLVNVKEKFGEPAFILTEPSAELTQEYVYPLNHVAFQFVRENVQQMPKSKSLLIFNVQ